MPSSMASSSLSSSASSPSFSIPLQRRLSARRGSQAASDPFGAHADLNHHEGRSTSSRLTIVRVPDAAASPADDHASPLNRRHSLQHRRAGSGPSPNTAPEPAHGHAPRLSFANASFGRPGAPGGSRPGSPTTTRAGSPTTSLRSGSPGPSGVARPSPTASVSKFKLSPEEIVRIARESTHPHAATAGGVGGTASAPGSARGGSSAASSLAGSPVLQTLPLPSTSGGGVQPASFTPLPDTIWLPFVERATEVSTLLSNAPASRLLALLAQTLEAPGTPRGRGRLDTDGDPRAWSYAQLECWLKRVDRAEADDRTWVRKARICVLSHSELIWERLKGALGVPPELDTSEEPPVEEALVLGDENAIESDPEDLPSPPASPGGVPADGSDEPDSDAGSDFDDVAVSIEPVLASTDSAPVSDPSGLGDIGEEDEDEDRAAEGAVVPPRDEIVHGLRICTSPQPPARSPNMPAGWPGHSPFLLAAASPGPPGASPSLLALDPGAGAGGRSPAPVTGHALAQLAGAPGPAPRSRSFSSSSFGSAGGAGYYDVFAERGPGNPLFPSSFAQLALAPTLSANNPALRSPNPPPLPAYALRSGEVTPQDKSRSLSTSAARRKLPSWADGFSRSQHEYAVSTASGSSIKGDD